MTGIEPVTPTWKDGMLPLHHIRKVEEDLHSLRVSSSQARNLQPHSHGRDFKTILKDCQAPQRI
jgi:hypothetical protein